MSVDAGLPAGFEELTPFLAEWLLPRERDRYEKRVNSTMEELRVLYDAVLPRAQDAMDHLDRFDLHELPEPEYNLLQLLYSFITVSFAVDIFKQPRIPDASSANLEMVIEPHP